MSVVRSVYVSQLWFWKRGLIMRDTYEREIDYLRLSITDRCNLRCRYCMPNGITLLPKEEILTLEEIRLICNEAARLGIHKLKVTGGEPLVRKDCVPLIRTLKSTQGITQVTLTTNGVLLGEYAEALEDAGIDGINVSLDTLDEDQYGNITGSHVLPVVLAGIFRCLKIGIRVKVNAVLQQGINDKQWRALVELARDLSLDVRFIEMMPIGHGKSYETIPNIVLLEKIKKAFGIVMPDESVHGNGPAVYYKIPGFKGGIGFISAIHGKFCNQCNRIRLTSTGQLKPCLCYGESISIKEAVRTGDRNKVRALLEGAIVSKPGMHQFEQIQEVTEQRDMVQIGG